MGITFLFSMAASIGIAAIVVISAFYSPKKSVIIVLVLAGLYISNIVLYPVYTLSLDVTLATNSRIMRPMTNTEMIMHNIVRSPLWLVVPDAVLISSITWGMVVLRKNIGRILQ
ncbi:hypothetical protein DYY67_0769 [Candidatus Nitrosotalea sp. TS]|uniref:hypothetical protein n=1 Tax=Candidatus Nitrosotalea sp. TS TaxID=2341020 RepID=UPI00140C6054|nr:hypothetical protein [Candidatus Nitrosotalea sp. TS]NHI03699.1 hypothetical protein [Candidatus Nitrosotalea sp. TS]